MYIDRYDGTYICRYHTQVSACITRIKVGKPPYIAIGVLEYASAKGKGEVSPGCLLVEPVIEVIIFFTLLEQPEFCTIKHTQSYSGRSCHKPPSNLQPQMGEQAL